MEKKVQTYIFDMDNTLCMKRHGEGQRGLYDWHRVGEDLPNIPVINIYKKLEVFYKIIIVSGRNESCRSETIDWLHRHNIRIYKLFMRAKKDRRPDWEIKEEVYRVHIEPEYEVLGVFEDRDSVVKMWRRVLGLTCFQVEYGAF
jgi:FMN phosphatase YigB (HAD superfamily)